uniref:Uncharacterized protein n=1 Tax=Heterorhabditis bacteriophora TaxID=37862 RepID=A0A1I7WFZ5_HETBA
MKKVKQKRRVQKKKCQLMQRMSLLLDQV